MFFVRQSEQRALALSLILRILKLCSTVSESQWALSRVLIVVGAFSPFSLSPIADSEIRGDEAR